MPNRILRDCTDSEPVNSVEVHAERSFYRLIMKVDDYGRCRGEAKLLRPLLYPLLLDHVRESDLQRQLHELERAGLVRLYAVDGKQYLEIQNFRQRTRAEESKYPAPPPKPVARPPDDGPMTVTRPSRDRQQTAQTETEAQPKPSSINRDLEKPRADAAPAAADARSELEAHGVSEPSLSRCLEHQPALSPLAVLLLVEELKKQKPRNLAGLLVTKLTNGYRPPECVGPQVLLGAARGRLLWIAGKEIPAGAMLTQNERGIYWNGGSEGVKAGDLRPDAIVLRRKA